jgi:hypothetical protein
MRDIWWTGYGKNNTPNNFFHGHFFQGRAWSGYRRFVLPDGSSFDGGVYHNILWNGRRKLISKDYTFEGIIKDGNHHEGNYKYTKDSGTYIQGILENGQRVSEVGVIVDNAKGIYFDGDLRLGKPWSGKGKLVHNSGDFFVGEMKEGKHYTGSGKLSADNRIFEGDIRKGVKWNGIEKITENADNHISRKYVDGNLVETLCHLVFPNGNTFDGEMRDDCFYNGVGSMKTKECSFQGEWYLGFRWNGSIVMESPNGDKFSGELRQNRWYSGIGTITYPDGSHFSGEFFAGKFWRGPGKKVSLDNKICEGRYDDGIFTSNTIS